MEAANKAPAGGMTSKVNGQWYEGGEFMPVTGEFCGKGKNRTSKAAVDSFNAARTDVRVVWDEAREVFAVERFVTFSDKSQAWQRLMSGPNFKTLTKGY